MFCAAIAVFWVEIPDLPKSGRHSLDWLTSCVAVNVILQRLFKTESGTSWIQQNINFSLCLLGFQYQPINKFLNLRTLFRVSADFQAIGEWRKNVL